MTLALGPVLYFRGAGERAWQLSALVGVGAKEQPEALESADDRARPQRLAERCGCSLWRYDFALPLASTAAERVYRIGEQSWRVHLPAEDGALRIAYTACNGSELGDAWHDGAVRNERWLDLGATHERKPFHLLVQGGDQLYADPIWREVEGLRVWRRQPSWRRRKAVFPPALAAAVGDAYFEHYCRQWRQAQLAPILASVPSLMMWDDHDIFDGWGSWAQSWQECPTFQGIWAAAREHFALFQLAARADELPAGFSDRNGGQFGWSHRIGSIGILAPDLRSERSRQQVIGPAGRHAFAAALESMADCRQVLLVSTMPLVNPDLRFLELAFELIPGHQTWQDDLVDQWPSRRHWDEWRDLLRQLVTFSARTGARLTAVSGEIHLGAFGVVESGATRLHQLTSSGVVHPAPPAWGVALMERAAARTIRPAPDLSARLLPLPGLGRRLLRARNWLELELEGDALAATWHGEGLAPIHLALGAQAC
jgi:hypothetical protein